MGLRRAVVVDREPGLLARLTTELGRGGYLVEGLDSTQGLSSDLLLRVKPDLVVLDVELPGLGATELLRLVDALKVRTEASVVLTTGGTLEKRLWWRLAVDQVVERQRLREEGVRALGLATSSLVRVDVRAVLDEVLGQEPVCVGSRLLRVKLDLFSDSQLFEDREGRQGVFVALSPLPEVGQSMELELEVLNRPCFWVRGKVVWQRPRSALSGRPPGVGVSLEELSPEGEEAIERMLEQRAPLALDWPGEKA
ncbi:PilZ domain-containing protein [Hyalangium rubrum]|uniref:PilZ domain-containing protein n=1 Tax=Hyalangium rubrum TaxID=3103134 RepID=A0ABU5HCQ7_9BACT|nr:PilZ domain-containing protein [Hyalangium sp. s54d21]MDY7230607.1 PilZ domain-containing protein [Hyalangium sp. s54d21]